MFGPRLEYQKLIGIQFEKQASLTEEEFDIFEGNNQKQILNIQNQDETLKNQNIQQEQTQQQVKIEKPKTEKELLLEQFQQKARETLLEIQNYQKSDQWVEAKKDSGIQGYKKTDVQDGGIETQGISEFPKNDVTYIQKYFDTIQDIKVLKNMNPMAAEVKLIEQFDNDFKLLYIEVSPPMSTNRYTILLQGKIVENNITYYIQTSVLLPKNYQIKDVSKLILSEMKFYTFIIKPIPNSAENVTLQFMSSQKMGGSLPGFILNKIKDNRGVDQIKFMKKYIENTKKEEAKKKK